MFHPKFKISNRTANALTAIERARGFLEATSLSQQWLEKMQNKALVLEAHHTTHIEGTQLTLEESEQLWDGQHLAEVNPNDAKELLNYRQAFELVSHYVNDGGPITEGLIREIHKRLVEGVRGNSATPGAYRKIQNYVVNSKTKEVIYTPPPVYEIPSMMQAFIDWLNKEEDIHPVLVSGIAQFQLVHIHPFLDGNGRTARLLSTLCLYRKGYDFKKLFTISEYYDKNRSDYYKAIQSVRTQDMDMTQWLEYFSEGLATQLREIKDLGKQVIQQSISAKQHHLSERQKLAIEYMTTEGSLSIQDFEKICPGVTRRTLQRELRDLIDKGIIVSSGATSNLVYRLKEEK
ncbi:MAG: Fic family protein [Gammaproteobacteria bacterium]|nr:Fic family protein [Gammaproteobacteria bacterium]